MTKTLKNSLFALGLAAAVPAVLAQPQAGDWEFTLGGGGGSDTDFNNGGVRVDAGFGYFFNENLEVALRQNISFADSGVDEEWGGSTIAAIDWHFQLGKFVPFIGANFGLDYNEDDSVWGIGPEVGVKYYVHEKTFLFVRGDYRWLFDDFGEADNNADDGRFNLYFGIGFNFGRK
jgi:hypothetical protein